MKGRWRIIQIPDYVSDYRDMMEPAYIFFDGKGGGEFAFGCVTGYNTAVVAGATLAFVSALPDNGSDCQEYVDQGDTVYGCNGVVYRPTYYQDEQVYEIVSSDEETPKPSTQASNDSDIELSLQSPYIRGDRVRTLQNALIAIGFSVGGGADGVFGRGTDDAVRAFQDWYGLPVTGVVDTETANAIADEYTATLAPEQPPAPAAEPATTGQETQSAPAEAPAESGEDASMTQDAAPAAGEPEAAEPAAEEAPAEAGETEAPASDGTPESEPATEEGSDGSSSGESSN